MALASVPPTIYHLALRDEWEAALRSAAPYGRSTIGRSVAEEGFVHCCLPEQAPRIAERFYKGQHEVVLLSIDTAKVDAEVRMENLEGGSEPFPHVYGPLPLGAVRTAEPVPVDGDGALAVAALFATGEAAPSGPVNA